MINLNYVLIVFDFLVLLCFSTRALGTTNEVVDALPSVAQASVAAQLPALGEASPIQQGERDPFWPIGYVPPSKPGGSVGPAKTNGAELVKEPLSPGASLSGMLKIGGVIRSGGKFYATINGFTVQTGEVVTVVAEGEVYKFVVETIDFKTVQIKPLK